MADANGISTATSGGARNTRQEDINDASYHLCLARGVLNVLSDRYSDENTERDVGEALSAALHHVCEAKRIIDTPEARPSKAGA